MLYHVAYKSSDVPIAPHLKTTPKKFSIVGNLHIRSLYRRQSLNKAERIRGTTDSSLFGEPGGKL